MRLTGPIAGCGFQTLRIYVQNLGAVIFAPDADTFELRENFERDFFFGFASHEAPLL
jgi:hypothetical protein